MLKKKEYQAQAYKEQMNVQRSTFNVQVSEDSDIQYQDFVSIDISTPHGSRCRLLKR